MSKKQEKILKIIANHSPEKIGVKHILYKIDGNKLIIKFVVESARAPRLSSYLNSLSLLLQDIEKIKIESNVHILKEREIKKTKEIFKLEEYDLIPRFSF